MLFLFVKSDKHELNGNLIKKKTLKLYLGEMDAVGMCDKIFIVHLLSI